MYYRHTFIYLTLHADGCDFVSDPLTIAGEDRGNLAWTETPIGFLANSECPCSQADISVQASRVCSGNFLDGGTWLSSNTSVCDFGTVGLQLCDAKVRLMLGGSKAITIPYSRVIKQTWIISA